MLKQSPELYKELLQPLYVDRKDEIPPGKLPYYQIPVFNFHEARRSFPIARDPPPPQPLVLLGQDHFRTPVKFGD